MGVASFTELAATIGSKSPRLGSARLVAIDGRAGSGKSTFAGRLHRALLGLDIAVQLLHTDDLLAGWDHPATIRPLLDRWIIAPLRCGGAARYRRYDWVAERRESGWTDIGRPDVLLIDGVTTASVAGGDVMTHLVFVHADRELCLRRGIERDGEATRPQWMKWMADEDEHFAADRTAERANTLVDGNPAEPHDPQGEFIELAR